MDAVRVREEGWLKNVEGYARVPLMEMVVRSLADLGSTKGRIGIESGYSWYLPEGNITLEEYQILQRGCPAAEIVNVTDLTDRLMPIKEPEQVQLMRQATAMCDAAQAVLQREVRLGMTTKRLDRTDNLVAEVTRWGLEATGLDTDFE